MQNKLIMNTDAINQVCFGTNRCSNNEMTLQWPLSMISFFVLLFSPFVLLTQLSSILFRTTQSTLLVFYKSRFTWRPVSSTLHKLMQRKIPLLAFFEFCRSKAKGKIGRLRSAWRRENLADREDFTSWTSHLFLYGTLLGCVWKNSLINWLCLKR